MKYTIPLILLISISSIFIFINLTSTSFSVELHYVLFSLGWIFELVGILLMVYSSSKLSNWIFDNWMKSLPDSFEKEKQTLRKKHQMYMIIGTGLVILGFFIQSIVLFIPIEMTPI